MGSMPIIIHSSGRPTKQYTHAFIKHVKNPVTILVQDRELETYRRHNPLADIEALPDHIRMLSPTRQYIMDIAADRGWPTVCMVDDDLRFFKRRAPTGDNSGKFSLLNASPGEVQAMFDLLENKLSTFAHVGVSAREGNNYVENDHVIVGRMMRLLAYNVGTFHAQGVRFDRIDTKQDFDVTLQLLRKGYSNYVTYMYGQGQAAGSGSSGGCAAYRNHEMMTRCAEELAALHPGFVRIKEKETKTSFGGGVRKDVTISWKSAYESFRGEV